MEKFKNSSFIEFQVIKNKQFDEDLKSNDYSPKKNAALLNRNVTVNNKESTIENILPNQIVM